MGGLSGGGGVLAELAEGVVDAALDGADRDAQGGGRLVVGAVFEDYQAQGGALGGRELGGGVAHGPAGVQVLDEVGGVGGAVRLGGEVADAGRGAVAGAGGGGDHG